MTVIVDYHYLGETKTTMFFCYLNNTQISLQMMYYDQEGVNTVKIYSNMSDESDSAIDSFFEFFKDELKKKNVPEGVIQDLIDKLVKNVKKEKNGK